MPFPNADGGSAKELSYDNGDRVCDQQHPFHCSKVAKDDPLYPYEESMNDFFAANKANYDTRHRKGTSDK
jgi:hypothetical protein